MDPASASKEVEQLLALSREDPAEEDEPEAGPSNAIVALPEELDIVVKHQNVDIPVACHPFGDLVFSDSSSSLYEPTGSSLLSTEATSVTRRDKNGGEEEEEDTEIDQEELMHLEAEEIEDEEIPVSYYNAILLNESYQKSLLDLIQHLQASLQSNQARQAEIADELDKLHHGNALATKEASSSLNPTKKSLTVFTYPYFKDVRMFSHPPNEETLRKKANKELDVYLSSPREWSLQDKKKLVRAVREDALRERMKATMDRRNDLLARGTSKHSTEDEKKAIFEELKMLKRESEDIERMPDEELFHNREEDFDWMRISAQTFHNSMSPKCCELMWKNMLHPSVNTSSWTKEEDRTLQLLAKTAEETHWDAVATELNTGRTGFLCYLRYQQKRNKVAVKRRWSEAEDLRLKQLVEKCRTNQFIPWTKVSYFMDKRTKDQCYQRYMYSLRDTLRKGAFTEAEDFMVMVGYKLFGSAWAKIADFTPHRTAVQLHSRYNTFLKANFESWTPKDDYRLLELVKEHGSKDWVKIASTFGNKTRTQCRNRFHIVYKWYTRDPENFSLNNLKCSSLQETRQKKLFHKLERTLSEFLGKQQSDREEEEARGFKRVDLQGYHMTPDGISIRKQDLYNFMFKLQSKLPSESSQQGYLHKKSLPSSSSKLGLYETTTKVVRTLPSGRVVTEHKAKGGRIVKDLKKDDKPKRLDKALSNFFRPSWPHRRGRQRESFKPHEASKITSVMSSVSKVLKCDSSLDLAKLSRDEDQYFDGKDFQIATAYKDTQENPQPQSPVLNLAPVAAVVAPSRPAMRTYARKRKLPPPSSSPVASTSTAQPVVVQKSDPVEKELEDFIPPCHSTLVGFRGLLLHKRLLAVKATSDRDDQWIHKQDIDETLSHGIYHHDIVTVAKPGETEEDDVVEEITDEPPAEEVDPIAEDDSTITRMTEKEADERLFDRMKALFFWPAVLASTSPMVTKKENLFTDGGPDDMAVCAAEPFDATDIIETAKQQPPPKRVKIIKKERSAEMEAKPVISDQ